MAATQMKVRNQAGKRAASKQLFSSEGSYLTALVFLFSFGIYLNSVFNDYNLDDELVTQNHRLTSKGISAIPEIFTSPYYEDKAGYKYEYRPIVLITFAIEHSLFGDNPHISHFINVLLYALLCVLLFKLLRELLVGYSAVFVAITALIFAAHPIHTEVVGSIKNRDELLALGFSLAALHFATLYVNTNHWRNALAVPLLLLIGILSKSSAITFAALIPVLLILFTGVRYHQVLFVAVLLSVPVLVYARLFSILQQVIVVAGLLSAVTILYVIRYPQQAISTAKSLYGKLASQLEQDAPFAPAEAELSFLFMRSAVVSVSFFLLVAALLASTVFALHVGNSYLIALLFFVFAVFYLLVRDELKLLLVTPIVAISCYTVFLYPVTEKAIEIPLVVFLCMQLLRRQRLFTVTALVNYAVFALAGAIFAKSYFFLMGLIFVGIYDKRLRWVTLGLGAAFIALWVKNVFGAFAQQKVFSLSLTKVPVLFIGVAMATLLKNKVRKGTEVFLLPIMLVVYFMVEPHSAHNPVVPVIKETYSNINKVDAVDLSPVQSVRPLKFIEYPLEKTDPFRLKLGTYMTVLLKYLKLIIIPYPLSFYYGYAYIVPTDIANAAPLIAIAVHLLLILVALYFIRKAPLVAGALLVYTIGVIVFSGLFIPIPGMMGDRFLFIPSIGFSMLLAWSLFRVFGEKSTDATYSFKALKPAVRYSLIVLLALYSIATIARNSDWKDRVTLFRKDIKVVEQSAQAQNLLGLHLFMASNKETDAAKQVQMRAEAVTHFQKAISIYPDFLNASFDLGRTYESMGKLDEAYAAYEQTMKIDTNFIAPCFSMALIQETKGNLDAAIPLYEKYLTKYPYRKEVYANLSFSYFKKRDFENSINVNKRLLKVMPGSYEPTVNIAKTYLEMGKKDSAFVYFQQSYNINPRDVNVRIMLERLVKEL